MEPIGCPETSVWKYHSTLCKIPKERRSNVHRSGNTQCLIGSNKDVKFKKQIFISWHLWRYRK